MTKFNSITQSPSLAMPAVSQMDRVARHRLIVLIPDAKLDSFNVTRRIWEIASSTGLDVLLLSHCHTLEEAQLRRKLVTMAAIIKDGRIFTDILIEHGTDWVGEVKNIWQPGDILACYAGQKAGFLRKPLDQVLQSNLEATVYVLSDSQPIKKTMPSFLLQAAPWLGSLAIIGSFFWVEAKLVELPKDWAHTSLLYVCLFLEIGLIWLWNSLFT